MRRAQPWLTNRSRALRANETSAEARLWSCVRNRRLGGFKFVRQEPIGRYFVDFVCREARLIIEIDGATHGSTSERAADDQRKAALAAQGYQVLRFTNEDVFANLDGVRDHILARLSGAVD